MSLPSPGFDEYDVTSRELTEADLKDKRPSGRQISHLKKAEPKPHKPHKPLRLDIREKYHTQLKSGEITEIDLKDNGLSYGKISLSQKSRT